MIDKGRNWGVERLVKGEQAAILVGNKAVWLARAIPTEYLDHAN